MTSSKRMWHGLAVFIGLLFIFGAVEELLSRKYAHPTRAIERRHLIWPDKLDFVGIFAEFMGRGELSLPAPADTAMTVETLRGLRLRTGAYGQRVMAAGLELRNTKGSLLCKSSSPFKIADNRWTNIELSCGTVVFDRATSLRVHIDVPENQKWAIYKANDGRPTLQLWFDDPTFTATYSAARNYGDLWSPIILSSMRWLTRALIAVGIVIAFCGFGERAPSIMTGAFIIWCGLLWAQFFETVSLHSPDEPAHAVGAFRSVTSPESWVSEYERLLEIGSRVQFKETFARAENPLIAQKHGERQVSADGNFIAPENRSGLYALVAKPMARAALMLSKSMSSVHSDPITYMRGLLAGFITLIVGLGVWMFTRSDRFNAALIFLTVCSIPGVLASYLTIWNYGVLTALGAFFCAGLMPDGSPHSRRRFLWLMSALVPMLAELARSQILWFIIGPLTLVSVAIFIEQKSARRCLTLITQCMLISLAVCAGLCMVLGSGFIPDKGMLVQMNFKLCELVGLTCSNLGEIAISFLFLLQIVAWTASVAVLIGLSFLWNAAESRFQDRLRWISVVWACFLIIVTIWFFQKAWGVSQFSFLGSMASVKPVPSFTEHVHDAYRALLSQTFTVNQDYFLIQTFYMAYGWLEVTGHNIIYFIYRNFLHIGVLGLMTSSIFFTRKALQLYVPLLAAFFIYFAGVWYASWTGLFTIVGRFVFPAIGLVYGVFICSIADTVSFSDKSQYPKNLRKLVIVVFSLVTISALYGLAYLLPLRFAVGYDL